MIELKPIKLWTEKSMQFPEGTLRIYIGGLHIGTAIPNRHNGDLYNFNSRYTDIIHGIGRKYGTLDEIITDIELSLKEFINQIIVKQNKSKNHVN